MKGKKNELFDDDGEVAGVADDESPGDPGTPAPESEETAIESTEDRINLLNDPDEIAKFGANITGLNDNAAMEDMPVDLNSSYYRIEYNATEEWQEKGKLTRILPMDQSDDVRLVVMRMKRSLVRWKPNTVSDRPQCKSRDAQTCHECDEEELGENRVGNTCTKRVIVKGRGERWIPMCEDLKWGEENNTPPLCNKVFTILALDLELGSPFLFDFKRTSLPAARKWRNQLIATRRRYEFPDLPIQVGAVCSLTLRPQENYFIPVLRIVERADEETAMYAWEQSQQLADAFLSVDSWQDLSEEDWVEAPSGHSGGGGEDSDLPF